MFLGTFQTRFSAIGRAILPKKFRQTLSNDQEIILTRGIDGCIWGFDKNEFEEQMSVQLQVPLTQQKGRKARRYLFSGAELVSLDAQSRFVIPTYLLQYAKVIDEIVIVGAGDHFEIWNPKLWEVELQDSERATHG